MDRQAKTQQTRIVCGAIALLILAAYWPVFRNGFVTYDDPQYITSNPHVLGGLTWQNIVWAFTSTHAGNWHPLTWISHMLDISLFGLRPGWHHFINLLLHTSNALLLFAFLKRATGAFWRSAMVAALFAVHPLHVESVAWASERKDLLSTFFFLLTLLTYAHYVSLKEDQPKLSPPLNSHFSPAVSYGLSVLLFVLGLMSKPMLVTTPFVLLLLDFWPFKRIEAGCSMKSALGLVTEKAPFLVIALGSSFLTLHAQHQVINAGMPFSLHCANAVSSYLEYLGKVFWPSHLSVLYPHPYLSIIYPPVSPQYAQATFWPLWLTLAGGALLSASTLLAVFARKRQPWFATGWFWYLGTLVPVIGLVQTGIQAMADRYMYIPSIGIFVLVVWGAGRVIEARTWNTQALAVAGTAVVLVLAGVTLRQASFWCNDLTLFGHALAVNPNNSLALCRVGAALGSEGKFDSALQHFQDALASMPKSADALYYTGLTYEHQGDTNLAFNYYQKALQENAGYQAAHVRLGKLFESMGKTDQAIEHYGRGIALEPDDPDAHYFMGLVLEKAGDLEEAAQQLEISARLKPFDPEVHQGLAKLYLKAGKLQLAAREFERLIYLNRGDVEAHINLGGVFWALGRPEQALEQYTTALRINPDLPLAHYDIGIILFAQGRIMDAWMQFKEALRLKPDYVEALAELGKTEEALGKPDEAIKQFREAARLSPTNANFQLNYANALRLSGKTNEASEVFAAALKLEPGLPEKLVLSGKTLASEGQADAAIARFRTALCLKPDWPVALNNLAWMLATHPQEKSRNGAEAVHLAERACELSGGKEGRYYSTLAAAYAECGRFAEAVATAEKARDLASAAGDEEAVQSAETRLTLYRQQQPYHQPATTQ